ncbi:Retrovirus-related Pol polyprotein from transposon TNT 1-94 [Ceratocystis lukuohia]|uniref:Retrovirus-related Pol polyprotein from transposon TNT 1-94 n=1 Tax=Ceratocystis lukuohia TaxID=2019550 RepID=A0ABR4MG39_9PEZI
MSNPPAQNQYLTQEDVTKMIKGIFETLESNKVTTTKESRQDAQPSILAREMILHNFPKLNANNWDKWVKHAVRALKGVKVLYLFKDTGEKEFEDAMDLVKTEAERSIDEQQAFTILRAGMDEETQLATEGIETVSKCWTTLKAQFAISTSRKHCNMMEEIAEHMKWQDGDQATSKWHSIRHRLAETTEYAPLGRDQLITHFMARPIVKCWMMHLPPKIAEIFERQIRQGNGTWNDVMEKIDDEILISSNRQRESNQTDSSKAKQTRNAGKPKCFFCQKIGHKEEECRNKQTWEQRKISANMSHMDPSSKKTPDYWIVDSGTTHHLTGDLTRLYSFQRIDPIPVHWGGLRLVTNTYGLAKIDVGGSEVTINVYHVDGLNQNLLSVRQLCRKRIEVLALEHGAFIRKNYKRTDLTEKDGLYTIPCMGGMDMRMKTIPYEEAHVKFGHVGEQKLRKLHQQSADKHSWKIAAKPTNFHCQTCVKGKITKTNGHSHTLPSQEPLDLIHMDISGNHPIGIDKTQYYIIIVDDASKYKWVLPIQQRKDTAEVLNSWKKRIELKMNKTIKAFRTDNAPELKKLTLQWQASHGSEAQFTIPGTSSQNGIAERAIRTINDSVRTILADSSMPTSFWPYAATHSAYIANRASIRDAKSPFELFFNIAPNNMHIHRWGCKVVFHNVYNKNPNTRQRNKLETRGREGILLAIDEKVTGRYTCWDIMKNKTFVTESLQFFENISGGDLLESDQPNKDVSTPEELVQEEQANHEDDQSTPRQGMNTLGENNQVDHQVNELETQDDNLAIQEPQNPNMDDDEYVTPEGQDMMIDGQDEDTEAEETQKDVEQDSTNEIEDTPDTVQRRIDSQLHDLYIRGILKRPYNIFQQDEKNDENPQAKRIRAMMATMLKREPGTYAEAIMHPTHASEWREAIDAEIRTLRKFGTWTEVPFRNGIKLVNTKFIFKIKPSTDEQPERFKARLVAQGFRQEQGVDFHETYAPTPKQTTTRAFFAMVCGLNLECRKVDARNAFAQAKLEEMVYVNPPPHLKKPDTIWKLNKALYGLRQASHAWRNTIIPCLNKLGLVKCPDDECIMINPQKRIIVLVYVDDIAVAGPDKPQISQLIEGLAKMIEIKDMGELKTFLGMEVNRNRDKGKMWLSQKQYIMKMSEELDITAPRAKPVSTPIAAWETLEPIREEEKSVDKKTYQSLIGTLMYPSVMTRPDIAFATAMLSQHNSNPAERHLDAAKRVARYLRDTASLGIGFSLRRSGGMEESLIGYSDADYANSKDRKSVSGMVFTLAGGPIKWKAQKQRSVATSTTEAEYVGFTPCAKEGIWIHRMIQWCLERLQFDGKRSKTAQTIKLRANTLIYGDNQAALKIANNLGASDKTKHIDIQHHAVKDWIQQGKVKLEYVATEDMLADGLTKPLNNVKFNKFRSQMNISIPGESE